MTIIKMKAHPLTRLGAYEVCDLDADLYVVAAEMGEWPRAVVSPMGASPWGHTSFTASLQVLDGGGRDAGSEMFDSATQDALTSLESALAVCPFILPRGRIVVPEVWGADMAEALLVIDRPERSICLVCRE